MPAAPAILTERHWFPPADEADEEGLLAIGGDLNPDRLILAYRKGIFPWYNDEIPLWWHPNPRFVLFPDQLIVSKSMQQVMRRSTFSFTHNQAFTQVIEACGSTRRKEQDGTWINREVIAAYTELHTRGIAYSFEAWKAGELVGGLYGILMGKVFFGESMFAKQSNSSKAAFVFAVGFLQEMDVQLIDCQVYTDHLASLGACFVSRTVFMEMLNRWI